MTGGLHVGVVGGGIAGLATTKVLTAAGHRVAVFESAPDIGGVWSVTRRYPGLHIQNTSRAYTFSDHPMPRDYPEYPTGAQMQAYLESYADRFDLWPHLNLGTTVQRATPLSTGGWELLLGDTSVRVDHLVVANGIYSHPHIPAYAGRERHRGAGGRVCAPSDVRSEAEVRGKHVVVVGYGKSACDIAVALLGQAASVTIVARRLLWKGSKRLLGRPYEDFILSRFGELQFAYLTPTRWERLWHGGGGSARARLLGAIEQATIRDQRLRETGLEPESPFESIARSSISLVTEGFVDAVLAGRLGVHRDRFISELGADDERPVAILDDGGRLPADVVVAATGFDQTVPFVDPDIASRLVDEHGDFTLYRHILPHDVRALTFCGYNSSVISALNAEAAAVWTAAYLAGRLLVPPAAERRAAVARRLAWMRQRTDGRHAHGTSVVPFSLRNIDEMLADLGQRLPYRVRARQWFRSAVPGHYSGALASALHSATLRAPEDQEVSTTHGRWRRAPSLR